MVTQPVAKQREPHQGARCQVEGALGMAGDESLTQPIASIALQAAQIDHRQARLHVWVDDLHRRSIAGREGGTQHLVAAGEFAIGPVQSLDFELPFEPQRPNQVVSSTRRLQLVQKPKTLLSERERQRAIARGTGRDFDQAQIDPLLAQLHLGQLALFGRKGG